MSKKLSNSQCLAYALPVVSTAWLMAPMGVVQGIYAKYYGLPLTVIATVLLVARLFDAVSDPLIGYCADRYYQRKGSYRPFILSGGLLFVVISYCLYVPFEPVGTLYFAVCFVGFYFAWTLFEMPHLAWPSALAPGSEEKTRIYSFRNIASQAGWVLFYSVPLLPIFASREITPETLKVTVVAASFLMLIFLAVCLKTNFNETRSAVTTAQPTGLEKQSLKAVGLSMVGNKPLIIFFAAYFLMGISTGMWYSLIFLYVDVYLGLGEQFAKIFLIAFGIGIVATPLWYTLTMWRGKKQTLALAALLLVTCYLYNGFLVPGEADFVALLVLKGIQTLGFTCISIVAPAMLSEIIDYSNWKSGTENSATYFAVYTFFTKTGIAVSGALGLGIAGWYGFDAAASVQSEHSVLGLSLVISWLPAMFAMLGLVLILLSPINKRRHQIIERRRNMNMVRQGSQKIASTKDKAAPIVGAPC